MLDATINVAFPDLVFAEPTGGSLMPKLKMTNGTVTAASIRNSPGRCAKATRRLGLVTSGALDLSTIWLASGDKEIPVELVNISLAVREGKALPE